MNRQTNIADELRQIAPGTEWPVQVPFSVPEGYFEQLPGVIMMHIQLDAIRPAMVAMTHHQSDVPEGYFDELPAMVLQQVNTNELNPVQAELMELAPFLANIPKTNPLTVPDSYFETLRTQQDVPSVPPMYVVSRNKVSSWLKWTVAACLTVFIGSTALLFVTSSNNRHNNIEKQLESLDDEDIVSYLQTHTGPFDNDAFIASSTSSEISPVQNQLNESVPLEAIEEYLQQTDPKNVIPDKK